MIMMSSYDAHHENIEHCALYQVYRNCDLLLEKWEINRYYGRRRQQRSINTK